MAGLRVQPGAPSGCIGLHDRDAGRDAAFDLLQQVGLDHQDLGAAVAQDPAGFVGPEMPVDGTGIGAQVPGAEQGLEKGGVVSQHQADHVAFAHAQALEAARRAQHRVLERGRRDLATVEIERRLHGGSQYIGSLSR